MNDEFMGHLDDPKGGQILRPARCPMEEEHRATRVNRENRRSRTPCLSSPSRGQALVELMGDVAGKRPAIIPIPPTIALTGTSLAEAVGVEIPFNVTQLQMMLEENCIEKPEPNALIGTFGIDPIPLEEGLRILAGSTT